MRAGVLQEPKKFALKECDPPECAPNQVRFRTEGTGVCASELPVWEGRPWFDYPQPPGNPGHEGWGVVEAVGAGVTDLKPGDRVAGFAQGTYAESTLADAAAVAKLPASFDGRPFPAEPLACAINALRRCMIAAGESVAIVGAGFQALLLCQLAAAVTDRVTVLARRREALDMAAENGARHVVLMYDHARCRDEAVGLTDGGYDCVIEATGSQWPLDLAAELTRVRGRLVVVGYHQDPRQVNMQLWNWRGLDVINAHERDMAMYRRGMEEAIEAVAAGRLNPWRLFTHSYSLEDLNQALAMAQERPTGFVKGLVYVS